MRIGLQFQQKPRAKKEADEFKEPRQNIFLSEFRTGYLDYSNSIKPKHYLSSIPL